MASVKSSFLDTIKEFFMPVFRSFYAVFALLLSLTVMPAHASTALQDLSQRLQAMQSFQASFTQITAQAGKRPDVGVTGVLSAQRPGQFRWEVKQPYEQIIASDGTDLRIYDPDLMQMTVRAIGDDVGQTPALLFTGNTKAIAEQFAVKRIQQSQNVRFILTPKAKDSMFESLTLSFKGKEPIGMVLSDGVGQTTEITFFNVKMNPKLPASLFKLTPPKGTDIIEE